MARAVTASRARIAELMSGVGALVLGVGIGSYLPLFGRSAALVVIVLGAVLHSVGMVEVHRLEAGTRLPRWTTGVYVVCWLLLAAGAILLAPVLR
jgi:drug/metabolite transporter (DMT)-like permease